MSILVFAIFWIACGFIQFGLYFALLQRSFKGLTKPEDYKNDFRVALLSSLGGPIALQTSILIGLTHGFHGFKWRRTPWPIL